MSVRGEAGAGARAGLTQVPGLASQAPGALGRELPLTSSLSVDGVGWGPREQGCVHIH